MCQVQLIVPDLNLLSLMQNKDLFCVLNPKLRQVLHTVSLMYHNLPRYQEKYVNFTNVLGHTRRWKRPLAKMWYIPTKIFNLIVATKALLSSSHNPISLVSRLFTVHVVAWLEQDRNILLTYTNKFYKMTFLLVLYSKQLPWTSYIFASKLDLTTILFPCFSRWQDALLTAPCNEV